MQRAFPFVLLLFLGIACGSKKPKVVEPTPIETASDAGMADAASDVEAPKSLFQRLGSKKVIEDVTEAFVEYLTKDTLVKQFAKLAGQKAKADQYKMAWLNNICKNAGGDCSATGSEVEEAHKGLKITDKQWDSIVTDFKGALDENKVTGADKEDLVAVLNQFRDDVIEVRTPPKKQ
jgi:hemoglobin